MISRSSSPSPLLATLRALFLNVTHEFPDQLSAQLLSFLQSHLHIAASDNYYYKQEPDHVTLCFQSLRIQGLKLKWTFRSGLCLPLVSFNHFCAAVFFLQSGRFSHGDATRFRSGVVVGGICVCALGKGRAMLSHLLRLRMPCFSVQNFSANFNSPDGLYGPSSLSFSSGSLSYLPGLMCVCVFDLFFLNPHWRTWKGEEGREKHPHEKETLIHCLV